MEAMWVRIKPLGAELVSLSSFPSPLFNRDFSVGSLGLVSAFAHRTSPDLVLHGEIIEKEGDMVWKMEMRRRISWK